MSWTNINLKTAFKKYPQYGNLAWEYNPLRNYRVNEITYFYKNRLYSIEELASELNCSVNDIKQSDSWQSLGVPQYETNPILYEPGQLADFETDELDFDLQHPVDIKAQYSYDNSVNLILNDGKNYPKLINTRFSPIGRNKYEIVDRKGDDDTNIYDQGEQFKSDTSLYKIISNLPKVEYLGDQLGGSLQIGNYHFYFKYLDADGNESDFFAETGLISIFKGQLPDTIITGERNENSSKLIKLLLTDLDTSYSNIKIYYTRASGENYQNKVIETKVFTDPIKFNGKSSILITITGFENTINVPDTTINELNQKYETINTQEICQNRLFIANVNISKVKYEDLQDISLRFIPEPEFIDYQGISDCSYNCPNLQQSYYNSSFIYNNVGYWPDELYRLGIVYIFSDNSLSNVFNVRGRDFSVNTDYTYFKVDDWTNREKIKYDLNNYLIINDNENNSLENVKGVIHFDIENSVRKIIGIKFKYQSGIIEYLKNTYGIKGFFFVRQKRIPTTLSQIYTLALDKKSHTPLIPYEDEYLSESFLSQGNSNKKKTLTHDYNDRLVEIKNYVTPSSAICPDYDVNYPYLNSLFTGESFRLRKLGVSKLTRDTTTDRHYYTNWTYTEDGNTNLIKSKIIGVEDNTKLVAIGDNMFSARAGEAEEAFRYEYLENEILSTDSTNLIRGSFGPYLGLDSKYLDYNTYYDIKIPGYDQGQMEEYFKIRYSDHSVFYPISDRISISQIDILTNTSGNYTQFIKPFYRGDCYICQFTHRLNRNFQDPSAPTNDRIVDPQCWIDNFEVSDGVVKKENFEKINLGDVNAIQLGSWITIQIRSTFNLNIRSVDQSYTDEVALTGLSRGFYPYYSMMTSGAYKIPEALVYNKGFETSLSEKIFFEYPDVPYIKDEFSNRIAYSNIQINNAFVNSFRNFPGQNYRDYPKTYGSITKLIELNGNLICIFEHGIALIPINERTVAGQGDGGNVYINTSNILPENPKIISDTFGSQWKESIIKTPRGIYGVDTVGKKIWRTDGNNFECISDFRIQEFLNQNISLTERELEPIVGIRNVKVHYNKFKQDVMFTFYDNLYGFEEKVWNVCFNEALQKWITFYSWVPSYSENIYNQYFSFDRNTSKWIAKLGISKANNDFSDGVVLSKNIISNNSTSGTKIGDLDLANRTLPVGDGITIIKSYELVHDNFGNWKNFEIKGNSLYLKTDAINLCSEFFVRGNKTSNNTYTDQLEDLTFEVYSPSQYTHKEGTTIYTIISTGNTYDSSKGQCELLSNNYLRVGNYVIWKNNCVLNNKYSIVKDDRGRRKNLSTHPNDKRINASQPVILLNIKCNISVQYNGVVSSLAEAYTTGITNSTIVDAGYYQSVVAVVPKYNLQFLTTDFWKHGQAGIIDIADKIYPTYWYGKQHPFEFEFVVADNPQLHKIFDDLEIISNKAAPESFHYEIVGECYEFSKDKKNMYIRQEATKELYQYNGFDVLYDSDYVNLESKHRELLDKNGNRVGNLYDKSTLFPLYYSRRDSINEIEDFYHMKDDIPTKNFSALSGGEIVRYENLDEYRIWNHALAVNLQDNGRMRGNMHYKEDKWNVQINPLNIVQKNEPDWSSKEVDLFIRSNLSSSKVPIELGQSPIPNEVLEKEGIRYDPNDKNKNDIPEESMDRAIVTWKWNESQMSEVKLKDKFIKIRIRYSGEDLAIISAIKTLYSISYA